MSAKQRLISAVAVGLVAVVGANQWLTTPNHAPIVDPTSPLATSSVLYCAGITNGAGGLAGNVVLFNATATPKHVSMAVATTSSPSTVKAGFTIAPYSERTFAPAHFLKAPVYAVTAAINGGGVRGEIVSASGQSEAPCASRGGTHWVDTGLSTLVGGSATLALFNPTATATVFNVKTYSANGFLQPAAWQGVTIVPKGLVTLDLSSQLVNTSSIGVDVSVVRGAIVAVADQVGKKTGSYSAGSQGPSARDRFALVPTANRALATVVVSNPTAADANITLGIGLAKFQVPDQHFTVAPLSSMSYVVTPNTAIPAAGMANVTLRSSQPVIASVVTGVESSDKQARPAHVISQLTSWRTWLLADGTGRGYGNALVSNTSHHTITITVVAGPLGQAPRTETVTLAGDSSRNLLRLAPQLHTLRHAMVLLTTNSNALLITATASASVAPSGTATRVALNGR